MDKMSNETTRDCFSALPDSVLLHILSMLKTNDLVTISVLSKRWQYLWTSVPTLNFYGYDWEDVGEFVARVSRTLLRCWNTSIERLVFEFKFFDRFASDVDAWARFAAEKNVRDLSLHFRINRTYKLPQFVYCNSILVNLSIRGCVLVPNIGVRWTCLKSLSIELVGLYNDSITNILSGSPMLEHLKITRCRAFDHIDIKSESIKELVIERSYNYWSDEPFLLEISAPNLQSLHISGDGVSPDFRPINRFRLMSVSSMLKVEHGFSVYSEDGLYAIEFLESLHHVAELELGEMCTRALAPLLVEGKTLSSPLTALTCLKVNAFIDKQVAAGIISLLKCSPNLEKLVLKRPRNGIEESHCPKRVGEYWESSRMIEKFSLPRLKKVKFHGKKLADAGEFTLTLVQVLLENAGFLECMVP